MKKQLFFFIPNNIVTSFLHVTQYELKEKNCFYQHCKWMYRKVTLISHPCVQYNLIQFDKRLRLK